MHNAPAVTYPVGRSSIQGLLGLMIWLLGVAAILAWAAASPSAGRLAVASGLSVVVAVLAAIAWWRTPAGELQWNAQAWQLHLRGACTIGQPLVVLDLQLPDANDLELLTALREQANLALNRLQVSLELNDAAGILPEDKQTVEAYNRDDCVSTEALRDWLEAERAKLLCAYLLHLNSNSHPASP